MPRHILTPEEDLERLADNTTITLQASIERLIIAEFNRDAQAKLQAMSGLADVLRNSQALADMLGRRRMFLEIDQLLAGQDGFDIQRNLKIGTWARWIPMVQLTEENIPRIIYAANPTVPNVPFREAFDDIISREPRLAGTGELVASVYSRERGFALAGDIDLTITKKIRDILARTIAEGRPRPTVQEAISMLGDFTKSYSRTVFRTNLNTAYSAGRFQQAADPDIRPVLPAFEYDAVEDSDVRRGRKQDQYAPGQAEDHLSLNGLIAATDWQGWNIYAPPNGYTCRCTIRLVSVFELMRRGIISAVGESVPAPLNVPSPAVVHPRFRLGRPDFQAYFGVGRR